MKQKCLTMVKVMTALVLAVLMMVGSVSNVVGAVVEQASFDGGSVLAASAEKGLEIAENANSSEEADADAPNLSSFEENEIVCGMKEDLAGTGANAELAATGDRYSYVNLYFGASDNPSWKTGANPSGDAYTFTQECTANTTYTFYYQLSESGSGTKYMGVNQTIPLSTQYTMGKYSSIGENKCHFRPTETATYTFTATFGENDGKITITGGSGGATVDTWTIAGNNTDILGSSWDTTDSDNDMDTDDGETYTKTYTISSVPNSQFEFKVVKDHGWTTAYPNSNFVVKFDTEDSTKSRSSSETGTEFYVSDGDEMTITFSNDNNHTITVSFVTPENTHDVTFSTNPNQGGVISPSGSYAVGEVTAQTVTASANSAYTFSGWTIGSGIIVTSGTATGASPTTTIGIKTKASGDYTVQANFTKKPTYPITVMTNSTSLGTAASSVAYGYAGQTITLTATEDAGTFGSWSVVSGGAIVSGNTKTATFTMPANAVSIRANFNLYTGTNTSKYYYDGWKNDNSDNCAVSSGSSYNNVRMLEGMYNGQKYSYIHFTSARDSHSSANKFSITKKESGTRYVYFNDHGSWDDGSPYRDHDPVAVFLDINGHQIGNGVTMTWISGSGSAVDKIWKCAIPNDERVWQVYFSNGKDGDNWRRTEFTNIDHGLYERKEWSNDYSCYRVDWADGWGSSYTDAGGIQRFYWGSPSGTDQTYESDRSTARYGSDIVLSYADIGNYKNNTSMVSPKNTPPTDYYVIVYYPNTNYGTINDVAANNTNSYPIVVASTTLPMTPDPNAVTVYAKDGTLRGVDGGNEYETFAKYADTKIFDAGGNAVGTSQAKYGNAAYSYETYGAVKGETITIETTISNTTATGYGTSKFNELYYVKGFCINGEVPDGTINNSGLSAGTAVDGGTKYTLTYTIPEDLDGNKLEITPIYYTADPNVTTVTFQVIDFPADEHNWGNTLYVYPFYGKLSGANNAMGAYPGQPMVYYGGQYYIQVPTKSYSPFTYDTRDNSRLDGADNAAKAGNRKTVSVSGMTLHNGYYDILHREIWGLDTAAGQEDDQTQTYDYDDFYKIYNEKGSDNIIFQYKYETDNDNKSDLSSFTPSNAASFTSTFGNGFEYLVDYKGRKVNLFGTVLIDSKLTNNPIYVVSEAGGEKESTGNIAGQFATQWHIFVPSSINGENPTYSKFTVSGSKDSIPPSVLLLEDENSFNTTTYPSALDGHSITDWKTYYTNLKKDYKDNPVLITYEKAKNDVTSDKATRNDGRWLFSATGEPISSNIRIDISQDSGVNYYPNGDSHLIEDPGNQSSASSYTVPDVSAYFTNMGVNGQQTYSTTLDSDKTYDFTALSNNANYKFMGWYFDNGKKISGSASATTLRNNSYTFVARFMYVNVGTLLLSHVNGKGTVGGTDYQGKGNVSIAVTVTNEEGITVFSDTKSGESITIPEDYIESDNNYDVSVTLTATPANNNAPGTTVLTKPSGEDATFFNYGTPSTGADGKTKTYTFGFNVKDDLYDGVTQKTKELVYTSYFIPYTFNYDINYEYYDRFDTVENGVHTGAKKVYNRSGTLTADEAEAYVYKKTAIYDDVEETHRRLRSEFVARLAPVVSNFGEDITWDFSKEPDFGGENAGSNYVYSINVHYEAVNNKDLKRNVTFVLPYVHDNGIATLTDGVGTEATATNYALIKESEQTDNRVNFGEIPVLTGGRSNGIYTEEEKAHWIAAPATIKDASDLSKIKNFNYWSIASTSAPTVEVARCYFAGFNFVAYDNYIITAVYDENPIDISAEEAQTYITFLETTRNQWNTNGNTTENPKDKALAADVLFNDFVLNYSYKAQDLYLQNDGEGDIRNLGVVVQRMNQLETSSDGSFNTDLSNYVVDPTSTETNEIKEMINDPTGSKITGTTVQAIAKNSLDNKNRIEIFEAIYSAAGWNKDNQKFTTNYAYKKYLYRAFSYMIDASGNIILSEKPAYFIMYDVATATNDN